jgi:hypothetical protein
LSAVLVGIELKTAGCRLAGCTSFPRSAPVTPSGREPRELGHLEEGDRRLSGRVAKAPPRLSSSHSRKSKMPRSMSPSGTCGGGAPFSQGAVLGWMQCSRHA